MLCHGGEQCCCGLQGTEFLHHLRLGDASKQHLLSLGRSVVLVTGVAGNYSDPTCPLVPRVQYTRLNELEDPQSPDLQVPLVRAV